MISKSQVITRSIKAKGAESINKKNNPRAPGEGGRSQTVGEGLGRAVSDTPHPPKRATSP